MKETLKSNFAKTVFENDYQRYMYYKDNAETMGRLKQLSVKAAQSIAAYYERKAKNCSIPL